MVAVSTLIEMKFLSVCPAVEAVAWLKEKRPVTQKLRFILSDGNEHQEKTLAARDDAYIDFGLARYGTSSDAAKPVYARGDDVLKLTFLAHFPNAGYGIVFDKFELSDQHPTTVAQLSAVATNPSLSDEIFRKMFEKKGAFEALSDEDFQSVIIAAADNTRLSTPYDDTFLDGYSDYSYHAVFTAAWKLSETVPATPHWASTLYHLLHRCLPPTGFDPRPAIERWSSKSQSDGKDIAYFLRSRLADLLKADDALRQSGDSALRISFYRRFKPWEYPKWAKFAADSDHFFDGAIWNENLWRKRELRDGLSQLCWDAPDEHHMMDKPNSFRGMENAMRGKHPEWFADENE